MRLHRKFKVATLAGVITAAAALGMAGATAPAAQASDGGETVAAPAATSIGTLVFHADPALAGQPGVILAVDATTGAATPVGSTTILPGTNVVTVPLNGPAANYAVVTPSGPVIWGGRPWDDDGTIIG